MFDVLRNGEGDVLLHAGTGKGKTLAYLLPLVNQIYEGDSGLKVALIQPNALLKNQVKGVLEKLAPDYVNNFKVCTPRQVSEIEAETCVIDEADLSLSAACMPPKVKLVEFLRAEMGKKGRRVIYSGATFPLESRARSIRAQILKYNAGTLVVEDDSVKEVSERVAIEAGHEKFVRFEGESGRIPKLLGILEDSALKGKVMIFVRTKAEAVSLTRTLKSEKLNLSNIIVTTDSMSRGIDIDSLQHVVHFYPPMSAVEYVHRVGRLNRLNSKISKSDCWSYCLMSDEDLSNGPLFLKLLINARESIENVHFTDISKFFSRNRSINKQIRRGKLSLP